MMRTRRMMVLALVAMLNVGAAMAAQNIDSVSAPIFTYASLSSLDYPVVAGDITDRPYRVVGEVTAEVRKATVFSRSPSQRHVYRELWERARRLDADAVVNAQFGDARVIATSWGSRSARGNAIKFLTDTEIAERAQRAAETD